MNYATIFVAITLLSLSGCSKSTCLCTTANDTAAIATLKNLCASQCQLQDIAVIDINHNGTGEYGFFKELAGGPIRSGATQSSTLVKPPVMSRSFGKLNASGQVLRSGYHFQLFLPNSSSTGVTETQTGYSDAVDTSRAETCWCCYAWPASYGSSGKAAFFVNHTGNVLKCSNTTMNYSGTDTVPAWSAAFLNATSGMNGTTAAGTVGTDTETWVLVN